MKSLKRWVLMLGISGPTVATLSCSSAVTQELRDAAIEGIANFVTQATFDVLDAAINPGDTGE